jgi:hypothetical protein
MSQAVDSHDGSDAVRNVTLWYVRHEGAVRQVRMRAGCIVMTKAYRRTRQAVSDVRK